jgi:hypothetical protein
MIESIFGLGGRQYENAISWPSKGHCRKKLSCSVSMLENGRRIAAVIFASLPAHHECMRD